MPSWGKSMNVYMVVANNIHHSSYHIVNGRLRDTQRHHRVTRRVAELLKAQRASRRRCFRIRLP